jgi:hypothetical protein
LGLNFVQIGSGLVESCRKVVELVLLVFDDEISGSEFFAQILNFLIESIAFLLVTKFQAVDL